MKKFFLVFNHKIKKIFFYFTYSFLRKIRILFKIDQKILINGQELILPPEHLLSMYNYLYPKYDKFISELVMNTKKNESVIDIGANVGDTLLRLINSNANLNYYCIEADDYFFSYLKKNKDHLDQNLQDKIVLIKELVGDDLVGNLSNSGGGTATLIKANTGLKSKTLDEIIIDNKIENIELIKVDIDGYDYNTLFSGMNYIKKNKPNLFFECANLHKESYDGFVSIIEELFKVGYKNWTILDNHGSIIFGNKTHKDVLEFIKKKKESFVIDIYCKSS